MAKIIGHGAPTNKTPGSVGQEYLDKDTKTIYTCTNVKCITSMKSGEIDEVYEWTPQGGGGASSWNDLTDRPFYENKPEFEASWDGDITGKTTYSLNGATLVKVSNIALSNEQLTTGRSAFTYVYTRGGNTPFEVVMTNGYNDSWNGGVDDNSTPGSVAIKCNPSMGDPFDVILSVYEAEEFNACMNGMGASIDMNTTQKQSIELSNGLYFYLYPEDAENPGYTSHLEIGEKEVVPLDKKFLPVMDSVIVNSSTAGSSKKFEIKVYDSGEILAIEI